MFSVILQLQYYNSILNIYERGPDLNPNSSFHTSLLYKRAKWGEKFKMAVINQ